MKHFKLIVLFALAPLSIELGCKDKLDTSCDENFLQADVNGLMWQAQEVTGFNAMGQGGHISVQAKAEYGTVRQMGIQVPNDALPGRYQLQPGVFTHAMVVYPGGFSPETGELTITVHDTAAGILKGTFSFSLLSENLEVQEGSFCVKY